MICYQVTKSHLSTLNILGILPLRQQLAKGRAQCWRFCSLFAVSLRWYAFPLPLVPTDQVLCVSPHGLYNGQEGMAGLLSCRQPKTRWYLRKGRAHAPETLTMFWIFLSSEMFVLKPWAFGDVWAGGLGQLQTQQMLGVGMTAASDFNSPFFVGCHPAKFSCCVERWCGSSEGQRIWKGLEEVRSALWLSYFSEWPDTLA